MKWIIFSDTHLSDHFNLKQFVWLKAVINRADRVIINGDFWDYMFSSYKDFENSEWNKLFPILSQKKVIYLPGNHDLLVKNSSAWKQFAYSCQDTFQLKIGKFSYIIQHGHLQSKSFDLRHPKISKKLSGLYRLRKYDNSLLKFFESLIKKKEKINRQMDLWQFAKNNYRKDHWYIFGHVHQPGLEKEIGYINPGKFSSEWARWLEIDENGFSLYEIKYA